MVHLLNRLSFSLAESSPWWNLLLGEMALEQKQIAGLVKYDSILVMLLQVWTAGERLLMIALSILQANLQSIGALPHSTAYIEGLCTLRS